MAIADPEPLPTAPFGSHASRWQDRLIWTLADWRPLPQAWRRRLRKRFARSRNGPFDVEHDGMKFRLYPSENYCDRVLFGRDVLPERAEHEALLPYLSHAMVFVDIGANVGTYSVFVGKHTAGTATLVALEPHPRTYDKLVFNLAANGLPLDNAKRLAAGGNFERLKLWSDGGSNIGHTSLLKEGTANPKAWVEIDVAPLPDILRECGVATVDVLKIDVEGFEDRALGPLLEGDPALWPHVILIETLHQQLWELDLVALLEARGYESRFETNENTLFVRDV